MGRSFDQDDVGSTESGSSGLAGASGVYNSRRRASKGCWRVKHVSPRPRLGEGAHERAL